mgnify:CR=1 FL=1
MDRGIIGNNQSRRPPQSEEEAAKERAQMFAAQGRFTLPRYEDLRTGDGDPLPPQDERDKRIDVLTQQLLDRMREPLMRRLSDYATLADRDPSDAPRLCAEAHTLIGELVAALRGVIAVADRKTVEFDAARAAIAKAEGEV